MPRPLKEDSRLEIKISSEDKEKLDAIAKEENASKGELIREWVRSLPDPREKSSEK